MERKVTLKSLPKGGPIAGYLQTIVKLGTGCLGEEREPDQLRDAGNKIHVSRTPALVFSTSSPWVLCFLTEDPSDMVVSEAASSSGAGALITREGPISLIWGRVLIFPTLTLTQSNHLILATEGGPCQFSL